MVPMILLSNFMMGLLQARQQISDGSLREDLDRLYRACDERWRDL